LQSRHDLRLALGAGDVVNFCGVSRCIHGKGLI
jgi:hypothetical protein